MRLIVAILLFFFTFSFIPLFAQGEIDDEEKIFYRNEKTYAINLNSNGLSGGFRYARRSDAFKKTLYEVEFAQIKHPKEIKISFSSSQQNWNTFVFGKVNAFGSLRGGLGLQKELYRKEDKGGISIRYFYTFGASLGLQKPVYYDINTGDLSGTQRMKFDSHHLPTDIQGKAPFFVGINETKIVPGIYGKFGFTFEFSKTDVSFSAIEAGVITDVFAQRVTIMAIDKESILNQWVFPAFFVSYRFGKVIDSQFKLKQNKIDKALSK